MRVYRHFQDIPAEARHAVMALGNFDGVHPGHQAVIAEAARLAETLRAPLGVLTFEPHPRQFFAAGAENFRLTPFRIKMRHLQALGLDQVVNLAFDAELAGKSAEAFVVEILQEGLDVAHVVCGYDFCFGKGRSGNAETLREFGRLHGFGVSAIAAARDGAATIYSSSLVRARLGAGDPQGAAIALGRPWEIEGRVEHGEKRGRQWGFPTANLALGEYLAPKLGVYAVKAAIDESDDPRWIEGIANIGRRPTLGGTRVQLEAHLFDFAGDLYDRHLRVALIDFIRAEAKFPDFDALRRQIAADCEIARARHRAYAGPEPGRLDPLPDFRRAAIDERDVYDRGLKPRRLSD